jgi:formylglycine-generating enzyme required for sulfatase activity
MKTTKQLIILCVFLTTLLGGGIALALESPLLTVTTSGPTVSLSWTSVTGATGYTLYYAPYPKADPIGNIPMGNKTSMSASLPEGSAFYVALQAYDGVGTSGYSNIEYFIISTPATYTNSLGQTFVLLPAGTFTMGSPSSEPGRLSDEGPQHSVTLTQTFYMQNTEVTQAQWETVMGSNPSNFDGCPSCPVENVPWNAVQEFIAEMNARGEGTYSLPTEAQWEYAARAGSTTAFYNGGITNEHGYDPNLDAIGWYVYNSSSETHPVAGKAPNAWGLYDMSGNVYEWCSDWFGDYSSGSVTDPTGPSSGTFRVFRGGSWTSYARFCRSAERWYSIPQEHGDDYLGFRLVLSSGQQ